MATNDRLGVFLPVGSGSLRLFNQLEMKHLTSVILLLFGFSMQFSAHAQVDDLGEIIEWLEDQCASDAADSLEYCGVLELANDCMAGDTLACEELAGILAVWGELDDDDGDDDDGDDDETDENDGDDESDDDDGEEETDGNGDDDDESDDDDGEDETDENDGDDESDDDDGEDETDENDDDDESDDDGNDDDDGNGNPTGGDAGCYDDEGNFYAPYEQLIVSEDECENFTCAQTFAGFVFVLNDDFYEDCGDSTGGNDFDWDQLMDWLEDQCAGDIANNGEFCGILELANDCLEGDSLACEELDGIVDGWGDNWGNGTFMDCDASFTVVQGMAEDSTLIPNEVWVYMNAYDEDLTYFWSFGNEGTSTDPFPTWDYETSGPYTLCLTVLDTTSACTATYCEEIELNEDGFLGFMSGFTLIVMGGPTGNPANVIEANAALASMTMFPNPTTGGDIQLQWEGTSNAVASIEAFNLAGLQTHQVTKASQTGSNSLTLNTAQWARGCYFIRMSMGSQVTTKRLIVQ